MISICPPERAVEVARRGRGSRLRRRLRRRQRDLARTTARRTDRADVVDGGVIGGPPPRRPGTTRLYLSGPGAADGRRAVRRSRARRAGRRRPDRLRVRAQDDVRRVHQGHGRAAARAARDRAGQRRGRRTLLDEWAISQPELAGAARARGRERRAQGVALDRRDGGDRGDVRRGRPARRVPPRRGRRLPVRWPTPDDDDRRRRARGRAGDEGIHARGRRTARCTTPGSTAAASVRCSRSAPTAASRRCTSGPRPREVGTVLFTIDHHHGSEENQAGWEHHDRDGRRPAHRPDGHAAVLPAHDRGRRARARGRRDRRRLADRRPVLADAASACSSSTAATPKTSRWPTTTAGPGSSRPGGVLAIHDVFEDPADGGQAPFRVWQRAVAEGFTPIATTGSLRTLRR